MDANYVSELLYLTNSNSSSCWFDRCSERSCYDYCNCDSECYSDNDWDRCSCEDYDDCDCCSCEDY